VSAPERGAQPAKKELPIRRFASRAAWRTWLAANHERSQGLWIEFAKKRSGLTSVTYAEALEVALCYGWIDSQLVSVDEKRYRQRFTPRRARSRWSQINRAAVERLHAEGLLAAAGIREMEVAKRDGRWEAAYGSPGTMAVPPDLEAALAKHPRARQAFDGLNGRNRYAILFRLHDAKRADTRQRRLQQFVEMLEAGRTIL
jgi:uncharacterized protein YdeI (YjbR/CyaY-like superfamily)